MVLSVIPRLLPGQVTWTLTVQAFVAPASGLTVVATV
jgi:hypothetical protein